MKRGEIQVRHEEEIIYSGGGEALAQLPREAVGAPTLEVLKAGLGGALPTAGIGAKCPLRFPSNLSHSMILFW